MHLTDVNSFPEAGDSYNCDDQNKFSNGVLKQALKNLRKQEK